MTTLMITLKVNNVEFLSQNEKQFDDTQKECTSHFMMMKETVIGQSADSEPTSIECKQDLVVNESSEAKMEVEEPLNFSVI